MRDNFEPERFMKDPTDVERSEAYLQNNFEVY